LIPSLEFKYDPEKQEPYPEDHRTEAGKQGDECLLLLRDWLKNLLIRLKEMNDHAYRNFLRFASLFFLNGKDCRKVLGGSANQLVVDKEHCMYMMRAAHDSLSHCGLMLQNHFWN
jgi:hypothetical protein